MTSLDHKKLSRVFFWVSLAVVGAIAAVAFLVARLHGVADLGGTRNETSRLYPDHILTPGAINRSVTKAQICKQGTKALRHVSAATKCKVFQRYNISCNQLLVKGTYEIDHFIPLSLGGSSEITNLWPQKRDADPKDGRQLGFPEKDRVEVYLRRRMCNGVLSLNEARMMIWSDWVKVYDDIARLGKFGSALPDGAEFDDEEGLP